MRVERQWFAIGIGAGGTYILVCEAREVAPEVFVYLAKIFFSRIPRDDGLCRKAFGGAPPGGRGERGS